MTLRAGAMRFLITFRIPATDQDVMGEPNPILKWVHFADVYASMEEVKGQEGFISQQRFGQTTFKFRCRYIVGLTDNMDLEISGDHYDVQEILNIGNLNREYSILATQKRV